MKGKILARRYARALFDLAHEKNLLEKVYQELQALEKTLEDAPDFGRFLNSPEVDKQEKRRVLEKLFQDRFSNVFFNFLLVLLDKQRQRFIPSMAEHFRELYHQHHHRIRAQAITAVPLGREGLTRLREKLRRSLKAEVEVNNIVDPDILGGIVIQVDTRIIDGSVKHQLERLREQLLNSRR